MPNFSIFKSRTVWTLIFLVGYNDVMFVQPYLHGTAAVIATIAVNFLGMILATVFHVNPSQTYNGPSATVVD